ncbi:MAG: asparagine--tRNA ligase [Saprospiraceae bacterium]|jgi:asparaginyl-tRNA synthetase|nr:asparagine--tRNA ligase [Saprospiraceae bacterium]MBK7373614.1 asparagine--tRNA ligase [Saprospiraceae bacterium]MBK7437285.1 asparagine--tRNA ligase [Saprospiraceae bacterium]MBK8776174.1 asparagine--tRNA ligase [Saprospiraceae bacterium]MBK9931257.1 asparagine--tRNA ligase [Saprospiraceae bacterium]
MYNTRTKIKTLLSSDQAHFTTTLMGWVRSFRNNQFIALNDGSTNNNLQVVVELGMLDETTQKRISVGACIKATGEVIPSMGKGQKLELKATSIEILGDCDPEIFPIQPKKHSLEFLRENAHLRFRTNTFGAVFRVRHALAFAVHQFFNEKGFVYMHTPVITASDAEGAGEMFKVTTLPMDGTAPRNEDGSINYKEDFFGRGTNLTVSGQLEGELAAMAFSEIYTFGPTFRAENSNTTRHLAEFWMIEPEMAFYDLEDNANLAEEFIKYVIQYVTVHNAEDLAFLAARLEEEEKSLPQDKRSPMSLMDKLQFVINNDFERVTYTQAIDILRESNHNKKKKFQYPIDQWGVDLQSEHERYLVEKHFQKPVILTNYPAAIKAFYMRQDDDCAPDRQTVSAMDILAPGIGEIVGGSQREERYDKLTQRMKEMHIPEEDLWWYLDTRRFGACVHAGFGLGFERLVQFVTGMANIRDVIAFPRYPGSAEF